jgi:putative aldouronate transport system substrate-binding protein
MWETPQAKQMLALARKYYQEGFIRPDVATYKLPASEEQAGKWLTSLSQTIPGADLIWTNRAGFEVKSNPIEKPVITSASAIGSMLAIPVSAQDPARSMMLINLLHKDAYLHNLFVYGVEGTHYQKISDQVIQALPARKEGWNPSWFEFGNNFLNYLEKGDPDNKWDLFKQFNESAVPSPLVGFQFDPAPVQAEIAAVTNVSAAIFQPLVTGSVDPDKFLPEAIGKLKAAGSDKIIAEMQKQYDAWKAKK